MPVASDFKRSTIGWLPKLRLSNIVLGLLMLLPALQADVRNCACDLARPETLEIRECSLCKEVEKSASDVPVVIVRDINPRKPNRWLILPRKHYPGGHSLASMPLEDRTALWTAAIDKGREAWGENWGAAMNGDQARTQCHGHVHVGQMLDNIEYSGGVFVDSAAAIPVPPNGSGIWIHEFKKRLHVHVGEQITETVLLR